MKNEGGKHYAADYTSLSWTPCHGLVGEVKELRSLLEKSRELSPVTVVWPERDRSNWLTVSLADTCEIHE